ncbi:hypothetical protein Trydic_g4113 [Trypoxylus dichotomus]
MTSRLAQMQARFQQKQMQEKEEKLLKLYENQQQRTIERVSRGSAGSDGTITTTTTTATNLTTIHGGKVRQMFDERRQKAGIDRSYPLEPLKTKTNNVLKATPDKNRNVVSKTVVKSTAQKSLKTVNNGKVAIDKREVIESVYTNENGNENFEEHRERFENDADDSIKQENDIISLMNNHNLNDSLDNEELPNVGLDEVDEPAFPTKLANVGGLLPSQNDTINNRKSEQKVNVQRMTGKPTQTLQKKPAAQKIVSKAQPASPKRTPSVGSRTPTVSSTPTKSSPTSPSKTNMSARRASTQERAPSTNRPSARQTPRGPSSAIAKDELATCKFCNRRFAPDRLQVHEDICARTGKKRRKTYDALKHRIQGTELEPFARKSFRSQPRFQTSKPASGKKPNWRQTHDEFISTIRAAKMAQAHLAKGGKLSDLPPPPMSSNPDYVQCPHCGRRFNETAAARHIPKCATYQFNKPKGSSTKPAPKASGRGPYR